MRTLISSFAGVTAMLCIASACSSTADDCHETSTCASAGTAGTSNSGEAGEGGEAGASGTNGTNGGHGGHSGSSGNTGIGADGGEAGNAGDSGAAGALVSPCDPTLGPSAEVCLISDEFAIFVDPAGKDNAVGSKASPVNTITKAIQLASDQKIVIACNGTYDEHLKISGRARIYGGFACPGSTTPWTYEDGTRAKVAPTARGVALSIASDAAQVDIEDFEFDAKDGTEAGESSIAAFVKESTNVALHRVKLVAGKGVGGADGTLTSVTFPTQAELNGKAASEDDGGDPNSRTCLAGGSTRGGRGGDGGGSVSSGTAGLPDLGAGKGGTQGLDCAAGGTGTSGADAPAQPPSLGASKLGTITLTGWNGSAGTDGTPGVPGQGGGGGAGAATGGGGGGGGAGGCGGSGGTAGKAGGSSIALLILNSTLTLDTSEFSSSNAGNGGKGVAGQAGQAESGKGGVQVPDGCGGGKGGKGGAGGAGGGAAGGISVGIAYQGSAPSPDPATTISVGTSGTKGLGGVPGTNDGIDGKAQNILEVP